MYRTALGAARVEQCRTLEDFHHPETDRQIRRYRQGAQGPGDAQGGGFGEGAVGEVLRL